MGWVEAVYGGDKSSERSAPTFVSEERHELLEPDTEVPGEVPLPEIPDFFLRDKEAETVARKADAYVRFMAKR